MLMSEKQKMLGGELYNAGDPEIQSDQAAACEWMVRYNAALGADQSQRQLLLAERLAHVGDGSSVRPPFHCDYGYKIWLGAGVFLNFGCVILDVVAVTIGDGTQIGPNVQILTADHPRDPRQRALGLEFGRPNPHRAKRMDRRGSHHPAGRSSGGRCRDRRGQRRHP